MKLNQADCIYTNGQIEDLRAEARPLERISDPIPPAWTRVALVTTDVDHAAYRTRLSNEWIKHCVGLNTVLLTSRRRVVNFIENVKRLGQNVKRIEHAARRSTGVVICGASSILLEQRDQIARARARGALIAATNRACRAIPGLVDVVFYQESKPSDGQLLRDVPTIFEITAAPACVDQVDQSHFICTNDPAFNELFRAYLGRLCYPCGPSVTSLMVSYFLGQGFRRILLAGCPMCNTTGESVDYVPQACEADTPRDWNVIVPGWTDASRRTTYQMLDELDWIGKVRERSGVSLYDLSYRGARKKNALCLYDTAFIPFDDEVDYQLPADIEQRAVSDYIKTEIDRMTTILGASSQFERNLLLGECNLLATYNNGFFLSMRQETSALRMMDMLDKEIVKTAKELLDLWQS